MKKRTNRPAALVADGLFEEYYRVNLGDATYEAFLQSAATALPCVVRLRWDLALDDEKKVSNRIRELCEGANRRGDFQFGEIASMLPVIALQIQAGDRVLDLCAAPGNKTLALADLLRGKNQYHSGKKDLPDNSLLWANDFDIERACWTLTRHAKKARSASCLVSCWDGTTLAKRLRASGSSPLRRGEMNGSTTTTTFTKVLCDVPCSADGTLRKYRDTILDFGVKLRYAVTVLHGVQLELLENAFALLEEGGLVAYSTCSLNPVENEAVVQAFLEKHEEQIELLDLFEDEGDGDGDGGGSSGYIRGTKFRCMRGLETWADVEPFLLKGEQGGAGGEEKEEQQVVRGEMNTPPRAARKDASRVPEPPQTCELKQEEDGGEQTEKSAAKNSDDEGCKMMSPPGDHRPQPRPPQLHQTSTNIKHKKTSNDKNNSGAKKMKKKTIFPATVRPPTSRNPELRKCARVAPHLQPEAGGFFLALFRRRPGNWVTEGRDRQPEEPLGVGTNEVREEDQDQEGCESLEVKQMQQAGYFKRLREKTKWRKQLSQKWARFTVEAYDEARLLGFDDEFSAKRAADAAKRREGGGAAEGVVGAPAAVGGDHAAAPTAEADSQMMLTPWAFYGIDTSAARSVLGEQNDNLFFHTSRGHAKPKKVSIVTAGAAAALHSLLRNEKAERDSLLRNKNYEKDGGPGPSPPAVKGNSAGAAAAKPKPKFTPLPDPEVGFGVPLIQLGLSLFKRERNEKYMQHLKCRYRLCQQSVPFLLQYQRKRRLHMAHRQDWANFLTRDGKEGLKMEELLEWKREGRITGLESLNDEVGAALLEGPELVLGGGGEANPVRGAQPTPSTPPQQSSSLPPLLALDPGNLESLEEMMRSGKRIDLNSLLNKGGNKALLTLNQARLYGQLDRAMFSHLAPQILRRTATKTDRLVVVCTKTKDGPMQLNVTQFLEIGRRGGGGGQPTLAPHLKMSRCGSKMNYKRSWSSSSSSTSFAGGGEEDKGAGAPGLDDVGNLVQNGSEAAAGAVGDARKQVDNHVLGFSEKMQSVLDAITDWNPLGGMFERAFGFSGGDASEGHDAEIEGEAGTGGLKHASVSEIEEQATVEAEKKFAPVDMHMSPERGKMEWKLEHPEPLPEPGKSKEEILKRQDLEEAESAAEEAEAEGLDLKNSPSAESLAAPALKKFEELDLVAKEIRDMRDTEDFPDPHTVDIAMKALNTFDRAVPVRRTLKQACQAYAEIRTLEAPCRAIEATFVRKTDPEILKTGVLKGCGQQVTDNDYCDEPTDDLACLTFEPFAKKVDAQVMETCNGEMTMDAEGKTVVPLIPMPLENFVEEMDAEGPGAAQKGQMA
eukprot:g18635.t1